MKQKDLFILVKKWICPFISSLLFISCGKPVKVVEENHGELKEVSSVLPGTSSPGVEFYPDKTGEGGTMYLPNAKWGIVPKAMELEIPSQIEVEGEQAQFVELYYVSKIFPVNLRCIFNGSGVFRFCVDDSVKITLANYYTFHEFSQEVLVTPSNRTDIMVDMRSGDEVYLSAYKTGASDSDFDYEAQIQFIE